MPSWMAGKPDLNGHLKGNIIELNRDLYHVMSLLFSWLCGFVLNRRSERITDVSWVSWIICLGYLWRKNQLAPCLMTLEGSR